MVSGLHVLAPVADVPGPIGAHAAQRIAAAIDRHMHDGEALVPVCVLERLAQRFPALAAIDRMNAGDVIYFHTNNLHRGVLPTQGVRDVISVFLLPSPVPWDQQLERDGLAAIQDQPGGFPETLPPI